METNKKTSNSTPTLEEFISSKILKKKQQAIQKSYERTEPSIPYLNRHPLLTKKDIEYSKQKIEQAKKEINNLNQLLKQTRSAELGYESHFPKENYDYIMQDLQRHEKNLKFHQAYINGVTPGLTCLYTTTDNYGKQYRCAGNETFKANPKKFGFTRISNDKKQPGDIVQKTVGNIPLHAMMFVKTDNAGQPLYNYSSGGLDRFSIRKDAHFPLRESLTYTFTGLPSDSAQWKKEYEEIYGHKSGGQLIPKHQNSSKPLTEKNVRPVPSIVTKPRDKKKNVGIPKMIGI